MSNSLSPMLLVILKSILNILFVILFGICTAQEIVHSKLSDCDKNSFPELVQNRIISREIIQDTLHLSIGFVANCCVELESTMRFVNDTVYLENNNVSNSYCMCDCCFSLDFKITGIVDSNFVLIVNRKEFQTSTSNYIKLPDEYIFDKKSPINQGNKQNLAIGLWRTYYENSNKIKIEEYYSEEWDEPIRVWYKHYSKEGKLISIGIRTSPTGPMMVLEPETYFRLLNQ